MVEVTLLVTEETARHLMRLAKTGRTRNQWGRNAGYKAYQLATEHARPEIGSVFRHLTINGQMVLLPKELTFES